VTDTNSLLNQLRIDREPEPVTSGGRSKLALIAGALVAAALGAGGWIAVTARANDSPVPATTDAAPPSPPPTAAVAASGSVLDASGYVVARRQATVSAKITGKVVAVLIEEGQRVEADEIIARLDDANARAALAQAQAEVAQQRARLVAMRVALDNATPTFDRSRRQFAAAVSSAQSFDDAKANYDTARTSLDVAARAVEVAEANFALAQRNLDDTVVRAPFGGIVTVKAAQEGEMVSPVSAGGGFTRTGIGTIVDMDSLEVEVDVSENFISRVVPKQRAAITLNAYPDRRVAGRVIAIIPTADRAKATVKVRVGFEQKDAAILPEMGARVAFLSDDTE
jgi:RND family efflux transporter MFP subunit